MVLRDARLAPSSLRRAPLLLVLLALMGTALLGLLAQSAGAHHTAVPAPALVGPATPDDDPAPRWTFQRPASFTVTEEPTYENGATTTVTIEHDYDTQCLYGATAALASEFSAATPSCGVLLLDTTYGHDGAVSGDGTYVLSVRTVETSTSTTTTDDGSGAAPTVGSTTATDYSGVESAAYLHDTTPPVVEVVGPSGAEYTGWQVAVTDASTVTLTCTLVGPTASDSTDLGSTCNPGPVRPDLTVSGDYSLTVTATDATGRTGTDTSAVFTFDGDAPVVDFTVQPSGPSSSQPGWAWTSSEPGTTTCQLSKDAGAPTAADCLDGAFAGTLTATGTYTLTVTVTDAAGNVGSATSLPYAFDISDPAVGISPAGSTRDSNDTISWTVSIGEGLTGTCVLSTGTSTSCVDGAQISTTLAADGSVTLTVSAADAAGNSTTVSATYTRDTVVELTVQAPAGPSSDSTPTWTFLAGEDVTVLECVLKADGVVVSAGGTCGPDSYTPDALPGTSGTSYVLEVTVTDGVTTVVATADQPYLLDTAAPAVTATSPAPTGRDQRPTFTFTSDSDAQSVLCALTDGTSTRTETCSFDDATHAGSFTPSSDLPATTGTTWTFTVTVTDLAGNATTSQPVTYTLDTVAELSVVGPVSPGRDTTPTWEFDLEEGATVVSCVLTGPGVTTSGSSCTAAGFTAGVLPDTAGADYVLTVTVEDALGNVTEDVQPTYRLDTQLPSAAVPVPTSPSRSVSVTWTVTVDEPVSSASCQLRRDGAVVLSLVSCPGSSTVDLPGDGRYDLVVTLVDLAGNTSTTTSGVLVHDATTPVAPVVSPTSTTTHRTTATWTVSAEGGTSVTTCRVLREGAVFADWTTCGSTVSLPLGADGSYVLEVVSTDPVGPGPTTRVSYQLDTVAPVAPTLTGPTGPAQGRTPSWTIGTETGTTVECRLMRAGAVVTDWSSCAGSFGADLTGLPDGDYVLEARATDTAGNVSAVGVASSYVLDSTAPVAPVVTGPAGPSQSRSPSFTWTGEAGALAECQLSRDGVVVGGWVSCRSAFTPALDEDGTWTLTVRLTDAAGNVSDPATSGGFVLDTTAPPAPVVTPPKTPGRDLAPSWGAVVETGAGTECRLTTADGAVGAWASCALPHVTSLEGRPDGAYVLEVRATDVAGNLSPVGRGTYELDTVAPSAPLITSPTSPSRSRTPSFGYTVEPGATTRCRVTSGATVVTGYAPCSSPTLIDLSGLPDGTYTLTVRVADAAGNPGPSATGTYVLDTTGPAAPVLTLSPATPSPARSVTWAFTYEPHSTLLCRLAFPTGAVREITGCASPLTVDLSGLPDGSYTLTVRAVDAAGNVGLVLTEVHVIDSTALAAPGVTGPPSPGSTRTPRWTLSSSTASECRLTRGTTVLRDWFACSGSYTADLFGQPDGTYLLAVRAKDASGALSAATLSRYLLDTTAPGAATIVAPPTPSTNRHPTWTIASAELGATAQCQVLLFGSVLIDWSSCAVSVAGSPYSALDLTGRGDGAYTLVVRLVDAAGNRGVEASSAYVLDTSAPVGVGVTGPASPGNDTTPTWTFTTSGSAVVECRLTSVDGVVSDWDTCEQSFTADLTDLPDGTYTLAVRAVSEAGTPGPETTSAYVLSTAAPEGPTALALSGTRSTSNDRSPTWTFTLPSGTTGHCTVVSAGRTVFSGACTSPFPLDLSRAPDGSYTLTVTSVDRAGTASAGVSSTYVLDTVPTSPPTFTLVPGATGSSLQVQWQFTVVYGARAECRLLHHGAVERDWAPCTTDAAYALDLTGKPDGRYTLEVRAVDVAGNSSAPEGDSYLLDRTAVPVATFTRTPASPGTDRTATWTFHGPGDATLECRVLGPDRATQWASCGGASGSYPLELRSRPDGDYVLEVRVRDTAGRAGSASRATYTLDTTSPEAPRFSDTPGAAGNSPRPAWSWEATTDDRIECRLLRNGGAVTAWTPCSSPHEARLTSQGTYVLELRVVDLAGNVSPSTGSSYRYDTTPPPAPTFTSRPASGGSDRTLSWTFAVPPDATATCTVTRGASRVADGPCSGRYELDLSGRSDGVYTLTVRYTDNAGNVGPPAASSYTLRTVGMSGSSRLDPPTSSGGAPTASGGSGRGGTGAGGGTVVTAGSTSRPSVPTIPTDEDVPRSTVDRPGTFTTTPAGQEAAAAPEPETGRSGRARNPLLPDPLPIPNAPEALREAVTGTITRPTLPLTLLAIVIMFLLAQNRIDRRDPKLASAPVEAEPELDFTTIVRRPGEALS